MSSNTLVGKVVAALLPPGTLTPEEYFVITLPVQIVGRIKTISIVSSQEIQVRLDLLANCISQDSPLGLFTFLLPDELIMVAKEESQENNVTT